jgi:hypothetical protein
VLRRQRLAETALAPLLGPELGFVFVADMPLPIELAVGLQPS